MTSTAIVSTTFDDKYLWNLPLVTWCWNKIGVKVVCFMPENRSQKDLDKLILIDKTHNIIDAKFQDYRFDAPKHKEATYAQVARLYAGCLDLPLTDDAIITTDIDLLPFGEYLKFYAGDICLFGGDLLAGEKMYPMCYCSMTYKTWQQVMEVGNKAFQECLDEKLGHIEAEHFRGNYWCFDQELLYNQAQKSFRPIHIYNRAKLPERFATRRLDRDDAYLMERDVTDVIDFHLPRPGYEHFEKIITILEKIYPNDGFDWLRDYNEAYKKLL